ARRTFAVNKALRRQLDMIRQLWAVKRIVDSDPIPFAATVARVKTYLSRVRHAQLSTGFSAYACPMQSFRHALAFSST
ncbi:MAG: hypothetical protein QOI13_212, partial [Paraburkholderia sp.]|nr:hypothetical protein [Paraburkholderia sp.]